MELSKEPVLEKITASKDLYYKTTKIKNLINKRRTNTRLCPTNLQTIGDWRLFSTRQSVEKSLP